MKTTKRYRYYSEAVSYKTLKAFTRHLPKIGMPTKVEGIYHGKNPWYEVIVTGTAGKLVLRGCSWGYGGEGPRATEAVLKALGCHPFDVQTACFDRRLAMGMDRLKASKKPVWSIALPASGAVIQLDPERGRFTTVIKESWEAAALNQFAARFNSQIPGEAVAA